MTLRKLRINASEEGFTLIELMIVIAIIGILAAIAIPNFISYRDKSFCSGAESDAQSVMASIADYFSVPTNQTVSTASIITAGVTATLSNNNTWSIDTTTDTPAIAVVVTDVSQRCPLAYQTPMNSGAVPRGYWSGALGGTYTKIMSL